MTIESIREIRNACQMMSDLDKSVSAESMFWHTMGVFCGTCQATSITYRIKMLMLNEYSLVTINADGTYSARGEEDEEECV